MKQKKTERSRCGVSHNCIVELHSKVAHIRNMPAMKHVMMSTGTLRVHIHIMFAEMMTAAHVCRAVFVSNLNFSLNMTVKVSPIPASEA